RPAGDRRAGLGDPALGAADRARRGQGGPRAPEGRARRPGRGIGPALRQDEARTRRPGGPGARLKRSRPMLSHVSLGTNDAARAAAFYDPVLAVLGIGKGRRRGGWSTTAPRRSASASSSRSTASPPASATAPTSASSPRAAH